MTAIIREIVARHTDNLPLSGEDRETILKVLKNHPLWNSKVGVGLADVVVRTNRRPGCAVTRGFHIIRSDGSSTDISWVEALSPTPHPRKVKLAFRDLVTDQILAFRDSHPWQGQPFNCPVTGEVTPWSDSHVDHEPPDTFDRLVELFFANEPVPIEKVPLKEHSDGDLVDQLADAALAERWQNFHAERARLRIISSKGNLSLGRVNRP